MSEGCGMRMTRSTFAAFGERGRGPGTKDCGQPLEAGKGKEMDSSLQLSERITTLSISTLSTTTLILAQ